LTQYFNPDSLTLLESHNISLDSILDLQGLVSDEDGNENLENMNGISSCRFIELYDINPLMKSIKSFIRFGKVAQAISSIPKLFLWKVIIAYKILFSESNELEYEFNSESKYDPVRNEIHSNVKLMINDPTIIPNWFVVVCDTISSEIVTPDTMIFSFNLNEAQDLIKSILSIRPILSLNLPNE